ncbi:PREDICTED: retinoic acid receptor responder protein 1 [Mandrillus leucophaeus]|nr:PREDICTED: retinoic acid receptor responder protein 1 [Mandrillus leucophaeus]
MFALLLTIRGCPLLGDKSPLATQQVQGPLTLHAAFDFGIKFQVIFNKVWLSMPLHPPPQTPFLQLHCPPGIPAPTSHSHTFVWLTLAPQRVSLGLTHSRKPPKLSTLTQAVLSHTDQLHYKPVSKIEINPKEGCKVDVVFSTERYKPESLLQEGEGRLGKCSARVVFKNQKPRPAINVTCTRLIEKKKRQQEDYLLYKQMKQLKNPLEIVSIPDNHGHIDPYLRPIWDLAFLGSSYVMWEMTTQVSHYYLAQLTSVRQWKTNDDTIDFDYTVLLHELSTQEIIPCHIHLVWYPGKPLKVKYHCQELQTPEEASGTEEGSAVPTELSNF